MSMSASLALLAPELILTVAVLAVIGLDLVLTRGTQRLPGPLPGWLALGAAVTACGASVLTMSRATPETSLFGHMLVCDAFSELFKVLLSLALVSAVIMSLGSREVRRRPNEGEYHTLLLASGLAMLLMAGAGNLLMAYLSLEFVSLMSYVLTGFLRHNRRSGEAALKYLIYGGVASGAMIYGMSWIFGLTGAMDYGTIATRLADLDPASRGAFFLALLLTLTGFGYKIACVPFHMWAPDVYTGAPIPVTAFLAVGSKAAGFALLLRFFYFGVGGGGAAATLASVPFAPALGVVCAVTMTLGNLAAISQTNMKRLLAYSSIAHAGYALLGVVVFAQTGVSAAIFYLVVYYIMNLGAFWVVMMIANVTGREDIDAYRGLVWREGGGTAAVTLGLFLFSLAGLPPFAGFVGKWYVFAAAIEGKLYALAVIGALNSVISLYYYLRVVRAMFLDQPESAAGPLNISLVDQSAVIALSAATLWLGVRFGGLVEAVTRAGRVFTG